MSVSTPVYMWLFGASLQSKFAELRVASQQARVSCRTDHLEHVESGFSPDYLVQGWRGMTRWLDDQAPHAALDT